MMCSGPTKKTVVYSHPPLLRTALLCIPRIRELRMQILSFGLGGTSRETTAIARSLGDSCSSVIQWACRSGTVVVSDLFRRFSICRVRIGNASSSREFCMLRHCPRLTLSCRSGCLWEWCKRSFISWPSKLTFSIRTRNRTESSLFIYSLRTHQVVKSIVICTRFHLTTASLSLCVFRAYFGSTFADMSIFRSVPPTRLHFKCIHQYHSPPYSTSLVLLAHPNTITNNVSVSDIDTDDTTLSHLFTFHSGWISQLSPRLLSPACSRVHLPAHLAFPKRNSGMLP